MLGRCPSWGLAGLLGGPPPHPEARGGPQDSGLTQWGVPAAHARQDPCGHSRKPCGAAGRGRRWAVLPAPPWTPPEGPGALPRVPPWFLAQFWLLSLCFPISRTGPASVRSHIPSLTHPSVTELGWGGQGPRAESKLKSSFKSPGEARDRMKDKLALCPPPHPQYLRLGEQRGVEPGLGVGGQGGLPGGIGTWAGPRRKGQDREAGREAGGRDASGLRTEGTGGMGFGGPGRRTVQPEARPRSRQGSRRFQKGGTLHLRLRLCSFWQELSLPPLPCPMASTAHSSGQRLRASWPSRHRLLPGALVFQQKSPQIRVPGCEGRGSEGWAPGPPQAAPGPPPTPRWAWGQGLP